MTQMHHDFWSDETMTREQYIIALRRRLKRAEDRESYMGSDSMWEANEADKAECREKLAALGVRA